MHRAEVVQHALEHLRGSTYLEIGVRNGSTFRKVQAQRRIGVDPHFLGRRLRAQNAASRAKRAARWWNGALLFNIPSDEFFRSARSLLKRHPIDVSLVDGLHTAEQSLRDVENCLLYGARESLIVVHDCNPQSESAGGRLDAARAEAHRTGEKVVWNGDVFRTIIRLRATRPDLNVCVLDCDEGLGLVTRGGPDDMLDLSSKQMAQLTYADLAADRERLLNLQPPAHLDDVLGRL